MTQPCPTHALRRGAATFVLLLAGAGGALAAPFEIAVSPSRFELSGRGGTRLGQSLELHNLAPVATEVTVRTIDWHYSAEGQISYHDDLQPGSCRPWVALERRSVQLPARGSRAYRFQIEPPAGSPRGECRFMIAIEGSEPAQQALIQGGGASLSLPVTGRIAVAVYLALDGAEPRLDLQRIASSDSGGQRRIAVTVANTGDAHGRLEGSLEAVDSQGRAFALVPEGTPILPGQTRTLALMPQAEDGRAAPQPAYPVKVEGTLDWAQGSFKVEATLE